jgi:hypothetical protein
MLLKAIREQTVAIAWKLTLSDIFIYIHDIGAENERRPSPKSAYAAWLEAGGGRRQMREHWISTRFSLVGPSDCLSLMSNQI